MLFLSFFVAWANSFITVLYFLYYFPESNLLARDSVCFSSLRLYPGVSRSGDRGGGVRHVRSGGGPHRRSVLEGRRRELHTERQNRRYRRRVFPAAG